MRSGLRLFLGCLAWIAIGMHFIFFVVPWVRDTEPEYHDETFAQAVSPDGSWSVAVVLEGESDTVNAYAEIRDQEGSLKLRKKLRQYDMRTDINLDVLCTNEECRIGNSATNTWDFEIKKAQLFDQVVELKDPDKR